MKLGLCILCKDLIIVKTYKLYCDNCRKSVNVAKSNKCQLKRNPNKKLGVGSGGNQEGTKNPYWKGGNTIYRKNYKHHYKKRFCWHCGSKRNLCIHHIDNNRNNGGIDNLIELCRSCHCKIHRLGSNFDN